MDWNVVVRVGGICLQEKLVVLLPVVLGGLTVVMWVGVNCLR